ncbi:MAG: DUF3341 domain-containing protein [Planctomycetota bacterium]
MVAEFPDEDALKKGAAALRDQGFQQFDAHSPYPIHGMEQALGQPRSAVGRYTLGGAVIGLVLAISMTYFPSADFYPLYVAGKPANAWPAFVPIYFELAVLLGAFGTLFGLFRLANLTEWYHPTLKNERFARVTDDRFMLAVDAQDPRFDIKRTAMLLREAGGKRVTLLEV